ncbi:hypothetical protein EIP86_003298 [Pleurotus ostreatoroseus]|nr:hypothetical protein EIP86_003298 [Pleurotus ostreatoroseus]
MPDNLIVDTGSANLWVGADPKNPYVRTPSSSDTGNKLIIPYGSGMVTGEEYTDRIAIGQLELGNQGVGAASEAVGFDGADGILGIGPQDLTEGTLTPNTSSTIPTVVDNAFAQKLISYAAVGISFAPATNNSVMNGELTIGNVDSSKYIGPITFA